jgi:hypothetical protein
MIIGILQHLTPDPQLLTLPATVALTQRLSTNSVDSPPQEVTLVFRLEGASDIWFDNGTKTCTLVVDVDQFGNLIPPPSVHLVRGAGTPAPLVRGAGRPAAAVSIHEVITDSAGNHISDACGVLVEV